MNNCRNCEQALNGSYCHQCGQKDVDLERPFFALFADAIREAFDVDGRAIRTLIALLSKPGRVTSEFLLGRRQVYTSPIRLYLVVSLLFFVVVAWTVKRGFLFELDEQTTGEVRVLTELLPQLMFVLLPVFAVLLKALYRHRHYFDHLIHALHLHTAAYIALALLLPMEQAAGENRFLLFLQFAALIYLVGYLLLSLRCVYNERWQGAAIKTAALIFGYSSILAVSLELASGKSL